MNLSEQRTLAALMFGSFRQHGTGVPEAVEQSLEAAEHMILRSNAREKARQDAEIARRDLERKRAEELAALHDGEDGPSSRFLSPASS